MELFELTKGLVNISSVTGDEPACTGFLRNYVAGLGFDVELLPVSGGRANVFATRGKPKVVLSTHMDTVPPFFGAREDADFIYGRGACDAKGIIAAQLTAAERLLGEGATDFGLLFLAGEEVVSDGARAANLRPPGSEYIINGEPTDNRLIVGTKGMFWVKIEASGRMAHSSCPEQGEPAIDKLLDILADVRRLPLPSDPVFGPVTVNIGLISGGRAANIVPDRAEADLMYRTVPEPPDAPSLESQLERLLDGRGKLRIVRETLPMKMEVLEGFETAVASFTTDLPSLGNWGKPLLIGPGSIHAAHTENERVAKAELTKAVGIYTQLIRDLHSRCQG
jgi:acetylornithine deacetylase